MKLIIDSGSTKALIGIFDINKKEVILKFRTKGFNPFILKEGELREIINNDILPKLNSENINIQSIKNIHVYCAGCKFESNKISMQKDFSELLKIDASKVEIQNDLMGAARALCKKSEGFAAILGTGSNSCFYNGTEISEQISPLGYILGDEGSGTSIGKKFLRQYLRKQFNDEINKAFEKEFNIENEMQIYNSVYQAQEIKPNTYIASVSEFVCKKKEKQELHTIINESLQEFINNCLKQYKNFNNTVTVNFVGSIAHYFQDNLKELFELNNIKLGLILEDPFDELVKFHEIY